MVKACVICFHANHERYPKKWITNYVNSILNQTIELDIYEIDYGKNPKQLFEEGKRFFVKEFTNHADAHNYVIDKAVQDGYSHIFNTNIDDIYHPQRNEVQIKHCSNVDILSCEMVYINENNEITHEPFGFSKMSIGEHFRRNHNIIPHPGVVYSAKFWRKCPKLQGSLIPRDDFELWKWGYANGFKFRIIPDMLLYYRIHSTSISAKK